MVISSAALWVRSAGEQGEVNNVSVVIPLPSQRLERRRFGCVSITAGLKVQSIPWLIASVLSRTGRFDEEPF